eukprot:scaffold95272_cov50-Prasinocladus_malaysianus.AAC.2
MTTPDGSFSPQLWVQRVREGVAEQEHQNSSPSVSSFAGRPGTASSGGYSPASSSPSGNAFETPGSWAQQQAASQSSGSPGSGCPSSPGSVFSLGYTPPYVAPSPSRRGGWDAPSLPPKGYK